VNLERVNATALGKPRGFSHAVVAEGRRLVFLAGQTALDDDGRIVGRDVVAQFDRALRNLLTALESAGGEPDRLASLTIFVVDMAAYRARSAEIGKVWRRLVGSHYPAMAAVEVSRLWDADALVEVQGFAVLA
jgi:enamine deaminase RidA (YjgF/YER057c/UK114 family)